MKAYPVRSSEGRYLVTATALSTTPKSETLTSGIRVVVTPFYMPAESSPKDKRWVFGYRVQLANESEQTVQLLSRRWLIIDGDGQRQDVKGPGVIGQMPILKPGESFEYSSFCPLPTEWGTMEGFYQMRRDDGERFDAAISRFVLAARRKPAPVTKNAVE